MMRWYVSTEEFTSLHPYMAFWWSTYNFSYSPQYHVPIDSLYVMRDINGQLSTVKRFGILLHLFQGLCVLFVLDWVSPFIKNVVVFIKEQVSEPILKIIVIHYDSTREDGWSNHTCDSLREIYRGVCVCSDFASTKRPLAVYFQMFESAVHPE